MNVLRTGNYGPDWNSYGTLVDYVPADATVVFIKGVPHVKVGAERIAILCGDFIPVATEDGPGDGRCGLPVTKDGRTYGHACEGHTAEREEWTAMTEVERLAWEMDHDYAV